MEKFPYYRVTKKLTVESACDKWYQHFIQKNRPVAIVWQSGTYSVWVIGEESVEQNKQANREEITGKIVRSHKFPGEENVTR